MRSSAAVVRVYAKFARNAASLCVFFLVRLAGEARKRWLWAVAAVGLLILGRWMGTH